MALDKGNPDIFKESDTPIELLEVGPSLLGRGYYQRQRELREYQDKVNGTPRICKKDCGDSPRGIIDLGLVEIKTQKALGFQQLAWGTEVSPGLAMPYQSTAWIVPRTCLPEKFPKTDASMRPRVWFARPCPVRPRHGFVDSRTVTTPEEVFAIYEEARKEDPDAEVIVTYRLTGLWSGVGTHAGVAFGMGNDGVTNGGNGTVTIPTPHTTPEAWYNNVFKRADKNVRTSIQSTPYIEFVEDWDKAVPVQYRDGPIQPTTKNYIPRPTTITDILHTRDVSLLRWENRLKQYVKTNGNANGAVIYLPNDSLASHYAVHGIELGIPVLTTTAPPERGITVFPDEGTIQSLTKRELKQLAHLMRKYLPLDFINTNNKSIKLDRDDRDEDEDDVGSYNLAATAEVVHTAIATVHSMSHWDGSPHLLKLRALSVVALQRFFLAATMGEVRHWGSHGPGRNNGLKKKTRLYSTADHRDVGHKRAQIYKAGLEGVHSLRQMERYLGTLYQDFSTFGWDGQKYVRLPRGVRDQAGYGGRKWAAVALAGLRLVKATRRFLKQSTPAKWRDVVMAANNAVHTVHNNGPALNKWIGSSAFDFIANAPGTGFMNAFAAKVALNLPLKKGVE